MERWRRLIGHDGYLLAELRLLTPAEGGRGRALQSGYRALWWPAGGQEWLGSGPIDLLGDQRSIRPGHTGLVAVRPMHPPTWCSVDVGDVLHLRERVGQTLGVARVVQRVDLPDEAPLRLDAVPRRPGGVPLTTQPTLAERSGGC